MSWQIRMDTETQKSTHDENIGIDSLKSFTIETNSVLCNSFKHKNLVTTI